NLRLLAQLERSRRVAAAAAGRRVLDAQREGWLRAQQREKRLARGAGEAARGRRARRRPPPRLVEQRGPPEQAARTPAGAELQRAAHLVAEDGDRAVEDEVHRVGRLAVGEHQTARSDGELATVRGEVTERAGGEIGEGLALGEQVGEHGVAVAVLPDQLSTD